MQRRGVTPRDLAGATKAPSSPKRPATPAAAMPAAPTSAAKASAAPLPQEALNFARQAMKSQQGTQGEIHLLQFLGRRGGLNIDDPLAGDVRGIFGGQNPTVGNQKLFRKGGRPIDESREAANEAGYLGPFNGGERPAARRA